ncbi:MAG: hypothetical protein Q8K59_06060 [Nitrosomonas sp.]|nr:hypothetical protein [Nitrosomonas sp.]MDP1950647.1 hypothetical protein [Nitrosomonas sp.]
MIIYFHPLYEWLSPWLKIFERSQPYRENEQNDVFTDAISQTILSSLGRYGTGMHKHYRNAADRLFEHAASVKSR